MAANRLRGVGTSGIRSGIGSLGGFRKFILRGNVVDLAIGVVIGAAFGTLVTGFVKDIITPLIPAGKTGLASLTIQVPYSGGQILLGDFINSIIAFLIIALFVYYLVVLPVTSLQDRFSPKTEEEVTTRDCPFCLSTVPLEATRCAYCTAQLPPADAPTTAAGS